MTQQQNQDTPKIGFKSIQLLKTQTLGIGAYGKVCKAKCDYLFCAAKIIHESLFDPTAQQQIAGHREHRLPFSRFQQECEFMSAIKHPNIVQYLGTHQDPETGLPVLLMELMDDSLTHFLENSQDPVHYSIQVNFCHDITLAISYLHSNEIIHRDLSSNNVLLYADVKAKVTDFGMAKLGDANPRATRISLTMVPGTDVYMPPEAVKNLPVYTAKIDCFAVGVLIIQILTRQFPDPGDRLKTIQTSDPQFPTIQVPASEIERRQNHISLVDPNHPLLPIALHCLKDRDVERPSAQELCHEVAALKETPQYTESVRGAQERRPEQDNTTEREEQIRELQQQIQQKDDIIQGKDDVIQQRAQQIQGLQQLIGSQNNRLQEKDGIIREKEQIITDKDRELQRLTQQLQTSEQVMAQFQTCIHEPDKQQLKTKSPAEVLAKPKPSLRDPPLTHHSDTGVTRDGFEQKWKKGEKAPRTMHRVTRDRIELKWRKGNNAPRKICRGPDAVVDGDMVYLRPEGSRSIYAYNSTYDTWNRLPGAPVELFSIAVINNLLTTIGGKDKGSVTNQLFSLTGEGSTKRWKEVFPPMPTKQISSAVVCKGEALIVAGGLGKRTVEVMNIATKQWSTAADLPETLYSASATICGDCIYMLGGYDSRGYPTNSCSLHMFTG